MSRDRERPARRHRSRTCSGAHSAADTFAVERGHDHVRYGARPVRPRDRPGSSVRRLLEELDVSVSEVKRELAQCVGGRVTTLRRRDASTPRPARVTARSAASRKPRCVGRVFASAQIAHDSRSNSAPTDSRRRTPPIFSRRHANNSDRSRTEPMPSTTRPITAKKQIQRRPQLSASSTRSYAQSTM